MPVLTGDIEIEIECSDYPDNNLYVGWLHDNCSDSADVTVTFTDMIVSGGCVSAHRQCTCACTRQWMNVATRPCLSSS